MTSNIRARQQRRRAIEWARESRCACAPVLLATLVVALPVSGQAPVPAPPVSREAGALSLDSLVAIALETNPRIHAARAQIEAARARVAPAGALPDPMLGAGVMNLPVADPGFDDDMTMKTVAVAQQLPFPGKLGLARRAAENELRAAEARFQAMQLDIAAEVRTVYYDIAYLDRATDVVEKNQRLVIDMIRAAESQYAVGTGSQPDVLRARVEASRLAEESVSLVEARRAAVARLNALLARPSETPFAGAGVPDRIARAALVDDAGSVRFASASLGARLSDSPLPPLSRLQELAVRNSPMLRAHEAEIAAQAARLELAGRAHLPDFEVSVQYGQRSDRTDMASFMVSVPLPVHRRTRQDAAAAEARAELAAMEAGHHEMVNRLHADVAERYTALERDRAQLALFVGSILPQGRAAVESAQVSFRVGRTDLTTLLESERTIYDYEMMVLRALTDFAKTLAELERIVGAEVLP